MKVLFLVAAKPVIRAVIVSAVLLSSFGQGCNRFYTSTGGGKHLTRINRKNGMTRDVGKWQKKKGGDRIVDSMEWSFGEGKLFGLMSWEGEPNRPQSFVRINRQKPRGAMINNVTKGSTGMFDLRGLAIDSNGTLYTHSLGSKSLCSIDPATGAVTDLFATGLLNVIDLAYRINADEIWAVNGTHVHVINQHTGRVREFTQNLIEENPDDRMVAIGFNPVRHVPIILTQGEPNALPVAVLPRLYRFILGNGNAVFQATANITDGKPPRGGTIQCKRHNLTKAPSWTTTIPAPAALPTKLPMPSFSPSTFPTTVPVVTFDLLPFSITLVGNGAINTALLPGVFEAYLLSIYEQEYPTIRSVDLVLVDFLGPGENLFQQRRRRLQDITMVNFRGSASFDSNQAIPMGAFNAEQVEALSNGTIVNDIVSASIADVLVTSASIHASSTAPSLTPSKSSVPSKMPSKLPMATLAPVIPATTTTTPAPMTPMPVSAPSTTTSTPVASTPSPITSSSIAPGSIAPASIAPGSIAPGSIAPGSIAPGPIAPGPIMPGPITPSPISSSPITSSPTLSSLNTPSPSTPGPNTPSPNTPNPVASNPATANPAIPNLATPNPAMPNPATPNQVMPNHATPSPAATSPATPNPGATSPAPSPVTPNLATPHPATPNPVTPNLATPNPATPSLVTPSPNMPSPVTVTPNPVTPNPVTPNPGTPNTGTTKPETPSLGTPSPGTHSPGTPSLLTLSPGMLSPGTISPAASLGPGTLSPEASSPVALSATSSPAPSSPVKPRATASPAALVTTAAPAGGPAHGTAPPTITTSSPPSAAPSPSKFPSAGPSLEPRTTSSPPSVAPSWSKFPSSHPSRTTSSPSTEPSLSKFPSAGPSLKPTASSPPSSEPSIVPTKSPSPSARPSLGPTASSPPSTRPSIFPSVSLEPSGAPSVVPTKSSLPSARPSFEPTASFSPSTRPTNSPSGAPSVSDGPSGVPSASSAPSSAPTQVCPSVPAQPASEPACKSGRLYYVTHEPQSNCTYVNAFHRSTQSTERLQVLPCRARFATFDATGRYHVLCDQDDLYGIVDFVSFTPGDVSTSLVDTRAWTGTGLYYHNTDNKLYTIREEPTSGLPHLVTIDIDTYAETFFPDPILDPLPNGQSFGPVGVRLNGANAFALLEETESGIPKAWVYVDLTTGAGTTFDPFSADDTDKINSLFHLPTVDDMFFNRGNWMYLNLFSGTDESTYAFDRKTMFSIPPAADGLTEYSGFSQCPL